jgi:hypothetical protein
MTTDELLRQLEKYPGNTKVEDMEIYGMPLSTFCIIDDETDDEIPLFVAAKNGGFHLSAAAMKVLDRNRRPDPIN